MSENTQHTPVLKDPQTIEVSYATESLILRVFLALVFLAAGIVVLHIGQNLLIESVRLGTTQATVTVIAGMIPITLGKLGIFVTLFSLLLFFGAYRVFARKI